MPTASVPGGTSIGGIAVRDPETESMEPCTSCATAVSAEAGTPSVPTTVADAAPVAAEATATAAEPATVEPAAMAASAAAAKKAAAEAAYAASGGQLRTKRPPGMVKRSVALHLGYVGTAFNGLQVNRQSSSPDSTVEAVLERAVFGAGLIAESNFGDLKKVKWTRNSRTDKGVHSVATVVGLRVLLPGDERFDADPEGLQIAASLNEQLPSQVRVFSAQRVNKKFNARRFCFDRTYEYFLPAHLLLGRPAPAPAAGPISEAAADGGGADSSLAAQQRDEGQQQQAAQGRQGGASGPAGVAVDAEAEAEVEALAAALGRLRAALGCFVGTHPFHNYTAGRKSYVVTAKDREARKAARQQASRSAEAAMAGGAAATVDAAVSATEESGSNAGTEAAAEAELALDAEAEAAAAAAARSVGGAGDEESEEEEDDRESGGEGAQRSQRGRPGGRAAREEDEPLEEDDEGVDDGDEELVLSEGDEPGSAPRLWVQSCRWLHEPSTDPRDRVTVRHFRTITSFTADDPAPLVPGGVPCVRLRVRGMSFMLHQIRHMIGGALAVARGMLPPELLAASLAGGARVTVPRAPPHTLILADATFPPFRKAGGDEARVARWSGERLQLRGGGAANMAAFRAESLDPALNLLLGHPDWERFERSLHRFHWEPQAQEEVVRAHTAWVVAREERARQRRAEKEAAAAAAEAAEKEAAAAAEAAEKEAAAAGAATLPAAEGAGNAEPSARDAAAVAP